METILKFLKNEFEMEPENLEQVPVLVKDLNKLNKLFEDSNVTVNLSNQLRIIPRLQKNQIWTVKSEYQDFLGYKHKVSHPLIVIIKTEQEEIEEEDFVRINLISPFIEFASSEDVICNDLSLIGFPFLIETWNDQPMLTEMLDEYIGYFEMEVFSISPDIKLNRYQHEFRNIEVTRAKYLNNSVIALLTFLEKRQAKDCGVIISLFDKPYFPKFYYGQNQKEPEFALAARTGIDTEDKFIHFKESELPFEIFIRKDENGFIITILPLTQVKLFSSENIEINGVSNLEKTVFEKLKKGIYTLTTNEIHKTIKIRLK